MDRVTCDTASRQRQFQRSLCMSIFVNILWTLQKVFCALRFSEFRWLWKGKCYGLWFVKEPLLSRSWGRGERDPGNEVEALFIGGCKGYSLAGLIGVSGKALRSAYRASRSGRKWICPPEGWKLAFSHKNENRQDAFKAKKKGNMTLHGHCWTTWKEDVYQARLKYLLWRLNVEKQ